MKHIILGIIFLSVLIWTVVSYEKSDEINQKNTAHNVPVTIVDKNFREGRKSRKYYSLTLKTTEGYHFVKSTNLSDYDLHKIGDMIVLSQIRKVDIGKEEIPNPYSWQFGLGISITIAMLLGFCGYVMDEN